MSVSDTTPPAWLAALAAAGVALPPELPAWCMSRRHELLDDELELPAALPGGITPDRARLLLSGLTDAEAAKRLGISRQRAWQLRRALERALDEEPTS